jgi:hypothetical protein
MSTTKNQGGVTKKSSPTKQKTPPKVFISYSHKDEKYKNELVTMLAGLENQGIITIWQDKRIEPGEEWLKAIRAAMLTCKLALLLISPHFLASEFIRNKELPTLLEQRMHNGLIVIPIIIRPCLWKRDPILKSLQALPQNAQPVTNAANVNKRTQIWADVAEAIEKRIK